MAKVFNVKSQLSTPPPIIIQKYYYNKSFKEYYEILKISRSVFCPSALIIINIIIIICSVHYKKTFIWKTSHDALSKYEYEYKLQGVSKEVANRISRAMLGDQSGLKSIHAKLPKNLIATFLGHQYKVQWVLFRVCIF